MDWGVWFEPVVPVARLVELARRAESLGASVCFVADEGTERDVWIALTAIVLGTEHMSVAPAITNPFSRHPVTTAAAAATLAELAPGRVWHGLGVGGTRVLQPLDLAPPKPFTALKEAVAVNRALLAGESVGSARLSFRPPGPVPMVIAGRGPRVQQLAAEHADWVVLSAEPLVSLAATAARLRAHGAQLAWSAYVAYDEPSRHQVLGHFSYMALDAPPAVAAAAGLTPERRLAVKTEMLAGRLDAAAALLPPALVDQYAVAGTPEECATALSRHAPSVDLFMLPMNDISSAEDHLERSAAILRYGEGMAR